MALNSTPAVLILKASSTAKVDLEKLVKEAAEVTTFCVSKNVSIADIIITFNGSKDVSKRIKSVIEHERIELILLYNAKQIVATEQEYTSFVRDMRAWYDLRVVCFK